MPRRFIGLTVSLEGRPTSPPNHQPRIEYTDHDASFDAFSKAFGGMRRDDLPECAARAADRTMLSARGGGRGGRGRRAGKHPSSAGPRQ
ncbi:MAG: hypothetical protein IPK81_21135 [Rhodospirillales bacterium]|nr:MAG: hypothetical protein IPK81_21135 [Rhodospirillales bacterium]